jgi:hypothetical protein
MISYESWMEDDEVERDWELEEALSVLDPARGDPNYWLRFRSWVLGAASRELVRRRLVTRLTVGDVVTSWARTLVPTALLTAVVAGILLVRSGAFATPRPIGLEELLVSEVVGETIPVMAAPELGAASVSFASEDF